MVAPDRSAPLDPREAGDAPSGLAAAEGDSAALCSESAVRRHLVWALVFVCYLYPFPYFPRLNNPNENVRIWQTRALAQYHELDLTRVEADWGPVDDRALAGDRTVSGKAPGVSLLGVPVYYALLELHRLVGLQPPSQATATRVLRLFAVALPMMAFLFFFARWVERTARSAQARDLLVLGLGLGTPMYAYGLIFAGHVHGAALGFVAFALIAGDPRVAGTRARNLVAGASAGLAVVFEYQLAIVLGILAAWALVRHRRAAFWFALGISPSLVALGVYHTILFGRPWAFPYGHLANAVYASHDHARGFFGLGLPSSAALADLSLSVRRGLFAFSPFLGLGLSGAFGSLSRPRRDAAITVLAVTATMFTFQSGMSNWTAGWSVGPRYMLVVAPVLAAAIAWLWPRAPSGLLAPLTGGLVMASVFLCGLSGAVFPHYPEVYANPVFDLTVPLLRTGHAPYNIGRSLGLRGASSMVPLALIAAFAFAVAMGALKPTIGALRTRLAAFAIAGLIGGGYLLVLSRCVRKGSAELQASGFVESVWEPADPGVAQ